MIDLADLADALIEEDEPCMIVVHDDEIARAPLDGLHPLVVLDLLGVAPDHWDAIGFFTHGTAYTLDDTDTPMTKIGRATSSLIVDRTGATYGFSLLPTGIAPAAQCGPIVDAMRHTLGVAA